MSSVDLFSRVAAEYSRHRPRYPAALFDYLADVSPGRDLAWDCGTGNGQAAIELAGRFTSVHATDASAKQIALAPAHERILYRVERAEQVSLPAGTVDLVTVAIAVHWFDLDAFYSQVRRVLKPAGILAVWTYHLPLITPEVDEIVRYYYEEVVGAYWQSGIRYVHERYRTLPFPFDELDPPQFHVDAEWEMERVVGFLASWSATRTYLDEKGVHPLQQVWEPLLEAWGDPALKRRLDWPLHLRVGQVGGVPNP